MSEVADSMLFRQKLYQTFKDSGLLSKLKTTLRANLLQKLEKPSEMPAQMIVDDKEQHFHLRSKFLESAIAEFLKSRGKEYSLSIFMAECNLEEQDCLRFNELSQIINLNKPSDGQPFLFRLFQEFGKIKCIQARERSTQTDFDEPLSKKLELVDKEFRSKIDYWKLIPGSSLPKAPELVDQEQRLRGQFSVEKERLKRELQVTLREEISKKLQNQYNFRLHECQKQHQKRLNELKTRQKMVLQRLNKQKVELEERSKEIREDEKKMINKYEEKLMALEGEYRIKVKELESKEKDFWKKELELRAKKRQYEETIRLVKQKVVAESGNGDF